MGFLSGMFEKKDGKAKPSEVVARATSSSKSATFGGFGIGPTGDWDIDKAVAHGLERVMWVFRCVDVIAQNQAGIPIRLRKGVGSSRDTGEWVDDDRLWKLLNFRANSYERSWQFRYRLTANLLLSRRGAFVEVINGKDGRPSELHILPSGSVYVVPDPITFVKEYRVYRVDGGYDTLPKERVIWLRLKPHPTDPYAQMTPLMAAGVAADTDYLAHMFNRNFLANDGRPGMLISVQGQINPTDAAELKSRFSGGPARAGQVSVIEAEGIDIADLSSNPRDIQWNELLEIGKQEILMAFGVPESIMGNASGRTFDNADAERENFWMDTMVAHCDNIAASFDVLTENEDDDILAAYDYSGIDVLQRMKRVRLEAKRAEVSAGLATIDDYLSAAGEEPWDVVGTRIFWHPSGIAIAKNPEDQAAIMTLKPVGEPAQEDPSAAARAGAEQGAAAGNRQLGNLIASRAAAIARGENVTPIGAAPSARNGLSRRAERRAASGRASNTEGRQNAAETPSSQWKSLDQADDDDHHGEKTHPYLTVRHNLEGFVEGAILSWDDRQEKVVTDRLMHVKSRKGTRHWDTEENFVRGLKALDPSYSVEVAQWVEDLKASLRSKVYEAMMREARSAANDIKASGVLGSMQMDNGDLPTTGSSLARVFGNTKAAEKALEEAYSAVDDIIEKAATNQSARIQQTITRMDSEGASMKQIEAEVRKMIGTRAPWRKQFAMNVVTTAVESARERVYREAGDYFVKVWNSEDDERTRPTHMLADGQERKMSKPFIVGGFPLMAPGDPTAPPQETVNCRCWVDYSPSDHFYNEER